MPLMFFVLPFCLCVAVFVVGLVLLLLFLLSQERERSACLRAAYFVAEGAFRCAWLGREIKIRFHVFRRHRCCCCGCCCRPIPGMNQAGIIISSCGTAVLVREKILSRYPYYTTVSQ